jgi:hypothetical protein
MKRKTFLFKQNHHKFGVRYKVKETQSETSKDWDGGFSAFSDTKDATGHSGKTGLVDGGANRRILVRVTIVKKGATASGPEKIFKKEKYKYNKDGTLASNTVTYTGGDETQYNLIATPETYTKAGGGVFIIKEQWSSPKDWLKWTGGDADKLSAVLIADWDTNLPYNTSIMQDNGYGNAVSEIS